MHYRPFLLAKQGERKALAELEAEYHDQVIPIFVVPPRDWEYAEDRWDKSTQQHIEKLPERLFRARGGRQAFIDTRHLDEPDEVIEGVHLLEWIVDESRALGLQLIPVVDTDSTDNTLSAALNVTARYECGLAMRIPSGRVSVASAEFSRILSIVKPASHEVDVIFDLESEIISDLASRVLIAELQQVLNQGEWRSLTVGGAGFPNETPQGKGIHEVPRSDWHVYLDVRQQLTSLGLEELAFADYVTSGSNPSIDVNPMFLNISSTFRYTISDSWLFTRGQAYKASGGGLGGKAVPSAIRQLMHYPRYNDSPRSQVHDWFDQVLKEGKGGNPTTWRQWSTYHHLRVASDQVASLGVPSTDS